MWLRSKFRCKPDRNWIWNGILSLGINAHSNFHIAKAKQKRRKIFSWLMNCTQFKAFKVECINVYLTWPLSVWILKRCAIRWFWFVICWKAQVQQWIKIRYIYVWNKVQYLKLQPKQQSQTYVSLNYHKAKTKLLKKKKKRKVFCWVSSSEHVTSRSETLRGKFMVFLLLWICSEFICWILLLVVLTSRNELGFVPGSCWMKRPFEIK